MKDENILNEINFPERLTAKKLFVKTIIYLCGVSAMLILSWLIAFMFFQIAVSLGVWNEM